MVTGAFVRNVSTLSAGICAGAPFVAIAVPTPAPAPTPAPIAAPLPPPAIAPIAAPTPVMIPPLTISFLTVLGASASWLLVSTRIGPCVPRMDRSATLIEALPLTRPPGSLWTTIPETSAPERARTSPSMVMGRVSDAANVSPEFAVLVEIAVVVRMEIGVPAGITYSLGFGGGGGGTGARGASGVAVLAAVVAGACSPAGVSG